MALRNFFHAHRPSPPVDKCMRALRNSPGRHDRKPKSHSDAEPLVAPEVKAMSRNIACPAQDRLVLLGHASISTFRDSRFVDMGMTVSQLSGYGVRREMID